MKNMMFFKHRELNGLSQERLARQLGVCKEYVYMIENNRRKPGFSLALKIADLFETTIDHLFFYSYDEQDLSRTYIDFPQRGSSND